MYNAPDEARGGSGSLVVRVTIRRLAAVPTLPDIFQISVGTASSFKKNHPQGRIKTAISSNIASESGAGPGAGRFENISAGIPLQNLHFAKHNEQHEKS
jgi:hypothetical protein